MTGLPFLVLMALGAAVADSPPTAGLALDPSWSSSPVWDDGLAEVARYEAHRNVYGSDRVFETILIAVKEDFDRARSVKADPPFEGRDILTVLKLNIISRIPTDNYPYDYMTSVFVRRDDPRVLVKLAQTSQEWCGTTFKEVITWDGPPRMEFRSYFDGQADGSYPLPLDGAFLEEQLYLAMRGADLRPGTGYRFGLYDSLISNAARRPGARQVTARAAGEESLATPAGVFRVRRVEVARAGDSGGPGPALTFWIEEGSRRALVKFASDDGRSLLLTGIARRDYWSRR